MYKIDISTVAQIYFLGLFAISWISVHNLDLAVNMMLVNPSGVDCNLFICSYYPTIYRTALIIILIINFFTVACLMILTQGIKGFNQYPQKADSQRCENQRPEKPKTTVKAHKGEEKGNIGQYE